MILDFGRLDLSFGNNGTSFIYHLYDLHIMEGGGEPGCVDPASASPSVWIAFARRMRKQSRYPDAACRTRPEVRVEPVIGLKRLLVFNKAAVRLILTPSYVH
jgi:hypothetical protein